jgi:hypothetical protein
LKSFRSFGSRPEFALRDTARSKFGWLAQDQDFRFFQDRSGVVRGDSEQKLDFKEIPHGKDSNQFAFDDHAGFALQGRAGRH